MGNRYNSIAGKHNPEDQELIAQIAERSEAALGTLYDRYHVVVYSLALRITREVQEAEEVVLEVFLQVWQHASEYRPERAKVSTWLLTIARSRAIDHKRRLSRQAEILQPFDAEPERNEAIAASSESPLQAEFQRQVRRVLRTLPEPQCKALELAYFEGMSQSEIAEALGEPLGTVKTRIRTALATLRTELLSWK